MALTWKAFEQALDGDRVTGLNLALQDQLLYLAIDAVLHGLTADRAQR